MRKIGAALLVALVSLVAWAGQASAMSMTSNAGTSSARCETRGVAIAQS